MDSWAFCLSLQHMIQYNLYQQSIIDWYNANKRDLPWRHSKNPYFIWMSEVIFQQTRIDQGLPYYLRLINRFPTVTDLANANEDDVLKLWQGLGYYSRARNLHKTAKIIASKYSGIFPSNYTEIIELPGIGKYTAAAISSIAFNLPFAVVDGNVIRFLSRLFGVKDNVFISSGLKKIQAMADSLLMNEIPGDFNQAMMEIGALICTPSNPSCNLCPLNFACVALKNNEVNSLPIKKKSIEKRVRYFLYTIPVFNYNSTLCTLICRRTENDVWKNLFQFPLVEMSTNSNEGIIYFHPDLKPCFEVKHIPKSKHYVHILSHQRIEADFTVFECEIANLTVLPANYIVVPYSKLDEFALPKLIDQFIKSNWLLF